MADFVAVLKKTIDAQADKSPELRQRVYAKARATIEQKLVTANASQAVASRQRQLLEDAISEVERFYAPGVAFEPEPNDALEEFLRHADQSMPAPAHDEEEPEPVRPTRPTGRPVGNERREPAAPADDEEPGFSADAADRESWRQDSEAAAAAFARRAEYAREGARRDRRSKKGLIAAAIAVLVLAGAGYGVWANKDKLQELASSFGRNSAPATDTSKDAGKDTGKEPQQASTPPESGQPGEGAQQPPAEQKLTQRLMPDGTEVDAGPAGGAPGVGEGKSTAASTPATTPPASAPATAPASPDNSQQTQTPAPEQAVAVGQQALLYEERGGSEQGSVERGNVVWSVIQDSPGDGQPPEPAIRGSVTLPGSKLELKLTIRKNTDQSIPASHLVEMIFTVPDGFAGGAIDNVQRITFKDTEQAAGNPLIAVPSKIADNFFIIWLNDARTAVDTNLSLMRKLQWIDIPVAYRNGRRALISLEKGVPGDKAFKDVLGAN